MRNVTCRLILFLFVALVSCNKPAQDSEYLVLKGAVFYDGNGNRVENGVIVIKNGLIEAAGDANTSIPDGAQIQDFSGKYITPGLIDAHVHFFQTAFFDSRPDALDLRDSLPYPAVNEYQKSHPERYYEAYLRCGVTGVYDVGGFDWSVGLQQSAEANPLAPHISAAGRLITPAPEERIATFNLPGESAMVHLASEEIGRTSVRHNTSLGSTGIKVWGMQPQDSAFMVRMNAIADEIKMQGNKLIVHATNLAGAKAALKLGAKVLVHSVQDELVDDEFIQLAKANNTVLTPTLTVSRGYYRMYKAVLGEGFLINDPNNVVDEETKGLINRASDFAGLTDTARLKNRISFMADFLARNDSVMALNLKKLFDSDVLIAVGTDAGNPGTLHGLSIYEEMEKMQEYGIPADRLIIMATRNGAMAMERLDDFGTLEAGKMADLIILEKDPGQDISNMRSVTHFIRGSTFRSVTENF